ncbi:MAG: hypothetical protein ACK5JH_12255 [Anaerocolumna sp.]
MTVTNANDGKKALDNHGYDRHNDKPRNGASQKSGRTGFTKGDQGKDKSDQGENRPFKKDYSKKESFTGQKGSKPTTQGNGLYKDKKPNTYNKNTRSAGYNGYNKDKDSDEDKLGKNQRNFKGQGKNDTRIKAGQKEKEKQPDKIETIKRLEKEKKVLVRKKQELEQKQDKMIMKVKQRRTNTIDWTKGYSKGLYGDVDEDYKEYL